MKRVFDIFVSISALVILCPILIIVSAFIFFGDRGSVFFKQERVGRYGRPFVIYKFRSMVMESDMNGSYQTQRHDIRITRVGRFIRKTSLDELPQLFNVIYGDMSLVGPRPNVLQQREYYSKEHWDKRNSVRPGITGLAQALIRSNGTPEERTSLDLQYVDKGSFVYDLYILVITIKQIMFIRSSN